MPQDGGPTQYLNQTVYEGTTAEDIVDFYYDDEVRSRWDQCIAETRQLLPEDENGNELVYWVRKFPLACSDRDYVISRRTWKIGDAYYTVTKVRTPGNDVTDTLPFS